MIPSSDKIEALEEEYKGYDRCPAPGQDPGAEGAPIKTARPWTTCCRRPLPPCREAADRVLGLRPYRVQLIGGIVLHQGRIAEMKTGEGKTLVATLPAYLNALTGEGVHIVTVNDYLAKRDSEWMGKVYRFLGLTRGPDRP